MALVVPPPPVEALRRSPRISHRPRVPVSSRNGIPASLVQVSTVLVAASTLRTLPRRESYKPRSRVSVPSARHRAKSLSAAAVPIRVPVRAGTKRKRVPAPSDERDLSRYKLVVAEAHSDEEEQTPRQLRYAKRQRLLVSQPGIDVPDAATEKISPPSCVHRGQENRPYPAPTEVYPVATARRPEPVPADPELEASYEDPHGPVFTPLCRQPIYRRHRTADSTDPTLWKVVCQERVEHLKHVYRDMFRAVVHAEAAAADAKAAAAAATLAPVFSAEQLSATTAPEGGHTQFELYAPSQYGSVDADGDTCMETESSSEDDDEDDEDSDDEDMDQDVVEVAYERVLILDTPASPISTPPRLPRLSSIRVSSLEPYPPSARDGVSFIGRGTPADPQRLADWGTPVRSRALSSPPWTPEPLFFTPDMVPQVTTTVNVSTLQPDFGMDAAGLGMSWLDPSLHAESMSPSPSPPTTYQPSMSSYDDSTNPVSFGFAGVTVPHPVFSDDPMAHNPPLSATGCAVHESFLECLRGSGCSGPGLGAPSVFAPPSPVLPLESVMPDVELTPVLAAAPPPFPNPVLTQWVRSCIPSGSVTLGHALG